LATSIDIYVLPNKRASISRFQLIITESAQLDPLILKSPKPSADSLGHQPKSLDVTDLHHPLVITQNPTPKMPPTTPATARYKLIFFVPPSALSACKTAIFAAGAGRYPGPGKYTECCWTAMGTGQFRPGDTANPHIGSVGVLEEVAEARVETLCLGADVARKAVEALKR
jgi:hypothetical protein